MPIFHMQIDVMWTKFLITIELLVSEFVQRSIDVLSNLNAKH